MSANVLMTLPKYVSIPNKNGIPLSTPDPIDELMGCGKKRRLDHLTWEEKLQRKKLKNRVAAQTSRDRKKAKMDEMDLTIMQLSEENEKLKSQFQRLTADNEALLKHNIDLERNLNELRARLEMNIDMVEPTNQSIKIETIEPATNVCEPERWIGCGIKTGSAEGIETTVDAMSTEHITQLCADTTNANSTINTATSSSINTIRIKQEASIKQATAAAATTTTGSIPNVGRCSNESQKQYRFSCSVEDNCSLPSLQDMLEDFDASRLEELAESLLADVSTDFENDATKSGQRATKIEGKSKSMLGSMVGTKTEELESSKNSNGGLNTPTPPNYSMPTIQTMATIKQEIVNYLTEPDDRNDGCLYVSAPISEQKHKQLQSQSQQQIHNNSMQSYTNSQYCLNENTNITQNTNANLDSESMVVTSNINNNNTISLSDKTYYGTYDKENHSITVIFPDDNIHNFDDMIEEIVCQDDEDEYLSHVTALSPDRMTNDCSTPEHHSNNGSYATSPEHDHMVKSPATASDLDSAYESNIHSPPCKEPSDWSTTSSLSMDEHFDFDCWPDEFSSVLLPEIQI